MEQGTVRVEGFERIVIAVPALDEALSQYAVLLGTPAQRLASGPPARARLGLANTALELVERRVERARIEGLVLRGASGEGEVPLDNPLGLSLVLAGAGGVEVRPGAARNADCAVDHLVLRTGEPEACIALFRDRLGIRLALDRTVPEWGGRMLFFRAGGMTLEVIATGGDDRGSRFWGIAYRWAEVARRHGELRSCGVELSPLREGRKPGTRVATVKSHCAGIPTLLIGPAGAGSLSDAPAS